MNEENPNAGELFRPMNEEDRIRLLQMEAPLCLCGRAWTPIRFGKIGFIRQCPTCVFSASFCVCGFIGEEASGHPGFAF